MKKRSIIIFVFIATLFFVASSNTEITYAGWKTDTIGDASSTYLDITNMTISKSTLQITLAENPYFNDSSSNTWRFYNIWIDTSMEDTNPDTETWSTDVYEYVAHFDCRWVTDHWVNNSYINAFRYYRTSDGSEKVEGNFYWNGNSWVGSDPDIDVALVSGNQISFDIDGAIHRRSPLGTGDVVQGVANTANISFTVVDIAPNSGWVDEFDNMCVEPDNGDEDPEPTATPFSSIGSIMSLIFLGIIASGAVLSRRRK